MKKNLYLSILTGLIAVNSNSVNAQLKISSAGNVGIDAQSPVSRFSIGSDGNTNARTYFYNPNTGTNQTTLELYQAAPTGTYIYSLKSWVAYGTTSGWPTGVFGSGYRGTTATSSGRSYGVRGVAGNATPGYNYAIYGYLAGTNNGTAIYGVTSDKASLDININGRYAGFFRGNVLIENDLNVQGVFTNSDIELKKEIRPIESNSIEKLMKLQPIRYKIKNPEELSLLLKQESDTSKVITNHAELNSPIYTRDYLGLSAQDLQNIYPELVKTEDNGYLSVNYIGMIPVLIQAIKEQQEMIADLKKQISELGASK